MADLQPQLVAKMERIEEIHTQICDRHAGPDGNAETGLAPSEVHRASETFHTEIRELQSQVHHGIGEAQLMAVQTRLEAAVTNFENAVEVQREKLGL